MGTLQTWKKPYGALKDFTKVDLAHVNSDYCGFSCCHSQSYKPRRVPPKERHLKNILIATLVICPRAYVAYCIHMLSRRLAKTPNWTELKDYS